MSKSSRLLLILSTKQNYTSKDAKNGGWNRTPTKRGTILIRNSGEGQESKVNASQTGYTNVVEQLNMSMWAEHTKEYTNIS